MPIGSDEEGSIEYVLCQNKKTLLYLVNLGCVEMNPWNLRVDALDNPDYCVIDLDPQGVGFDAVIEFNFTMKNIFKRVDKVGDFTTPSWVKEFIWKSVWTR